MRALVQRVSEASVSWNDETGAPRRSSIRQGLLVLLGVGREDDERAAAWLAEKCVSLRLFAGDERRMDLSVRDIRGEVLVVSQFTLYAECRKGRRPSFDAAMPPDRAEGLYEAFVAALRGHAVPVETGGFGAMMKVALVNDGPVTVIVDSP